MKRIIPFLAFLPALVLACYDLDGMAVTACTGLTLAAGKIGTVVAVRRQCKNGVANCKTLCEEADAFNNGAANGGFDCFDSLHVYANRPILSQRTKRETTPPIDAGKVRMYSIKSLLLQIVYNFSMVPSSTGMDPAQLLTVDQTTAAALARDNWNQEKMLSSN